MRVFLTGATGWIGSAVIPELLRAGHPVLGLARSDSGAAAVAAFGAEVHRGNLDDLDSLRAGAAAADAVVHLAYNHDFSRMGDAAQTDLAVITAIGETLAGSDRPFVVASGLLGLTAGRIATEWDTPDPALHPRIAGIAAAQSLVARGVRTVEVRFAPTVHGPGDHGFLATLVSIARAKGVAAYVEDGRNRWPAVHRLDAADLIRRGLEDAPAGAALHAVAEEGVPTRTIAEAIGRGLDLPVVSVPADQATEHFGWIGRFFSRDASASSSITRELLGWEPVHPDLVADLDAGYYFKD